MSNSSEIQAVTAIREAFRCGRQGCTCTRSQNATHCPTHDDSNPSLGVSEAEGMLLVRCYAGCSQETVIGALKERGLWPNRSRSGGHKEIGGRRNTRYEVRGVAGELAAVHVRRETPQGKSFTWEQPDGISGLGGIKVADLPLFGSERLRGFPDASEVLVTEGEKAALALVAAGYNAVGTVTGASSTPSDDVLLPLGRFRITLWPDSDEPGQQHMERIAARLSAIGATAKLVTWPDAPKGSDSADFLATKPAEAVKDIVAAAREWQEVSSVELGNILDEAASFIRRFVVLSQHQADTLALWEAHSHVAEAAEITPYISVRSAEMRSGKTQLLEVLDQVAPNSLKAENISVAALAHSVDQGCTLLLDEVDSIFGKGKASETQETLRGILNSGWRRGGAYVRMVGQGAAMTPYRFSTFCPKVLSGIGRLPDTLEDRAIIIELKRKTANEPIERFRYRDVRSQAEPIRVGLAAWAASSIEQLRSARPELPPDLDDRAADGWEPLLAIADMAGGDWPQRARDASKALSTGRNREETSIGVQLLIDIRDVFDQKGGDRLSSAALVQALTAPDDSLWGDLNGKPLDARRLARMLKPYGLKAEQIRFGDKTGKGWVRADFEDAWRRYPPATETTETPKHEPVESVSQPPNVSETAAPSETPATEERFLVSHVSQNPVTAEQDEVRL